MLFVTAKTTSEYVLLFVTLVGLGYAHNGSNNSKGKCFVSQHVGDTGTTSASVIRTAHPLLRPGISPNKGRLCTVPPQPTNGVRKIHERSCSRPDYSEDCELLEGDALLPGNVMNYSCDPGYKIRGNPFVVCDRSGKWSPIPACVEVKCDPLSSALTTVECLRHGQWVGCDSPEHVGSLARVSCRSGYKPAPTFTNHISKIVECNMNGKWEPEPMRCEPVCGRVTRNQKSFPWHASIYKQTAIRHGTKSYICSGTVVGANLVLTAAHCIFDKNTNRTMDPGKLFVMAGHAVEVWNHSRHDPNVVNKIAVKNVHMNCDFPSVNKMHSASDIALIEVETPFEFSSALAPACLEDYDNSGPTLDPGGHGSIADFQTSVEHRYSSRYLSIKKVPYISYEECKFSGGITWSASLANDQFCAGHTSGSSNCVHSTGGGLMLMKNGSWYVIGIVSKSGTIRFRGGRDHCNHLAIYTNVSEYTVWIRDVMLDLDLYKSHPPCDRDGPFVSSTSEIANNHRNFPRMEDVFCLAPPQPAHGEWKSECIDEANCNVLPGTHLKPGRQLLYSCTRGYKVNGTAEVYCKYTGNWSNIPTCIEIKCEPLNSVSRLAICSGHHIDKQVSCDSPQLPQTRAEIKCRTGYETPSNFLTTQGKNVVCLENGMWLPDPITCAPMCGVETPRLQPLVVNGMNAHVGDFPWHATLYSSRLGMRKEFICGATIIRTNLLLTAAHCVYDEAHGTTVNPKTLFVLTGNMYRDYDSPLNANQTVSKSAVKNVYKHCMYFGQKGNYQSDIALLELQTPFILSQILLPVCLYTSPFDTEQILRPGTPGRIAGFGKTLTGETSEKLQTAELPFIPLYQCQESTTRSNQVLLNKDKFCAGNMTGPAVCEGDSGGGLVFNMGRMWHILGIVSTGLETDSSKKDIPCGKYPYSLYTKVSDYAGWIKDAMFHLDQDGSFPSCPNRG